LVFLLTGIVDLIILLL